MKIKQKLYLGFTLILVLISGLGILSYFSISFIQQNISVITQETSPTVAHVNRLQQSLSHLHLLIKATLNSQGDALDATQSALLEEEKNLQGLKVDLDILIPKYNDLSETYNPLMVKIENLIIEGKSLIDKRQNILSQDRTVQASSQSQAHHSSFE